MKTKIYKYACYSAFMAAAVFSALGCSFTAVGRGEFDGLTKRVDKLETVVLGPKSTNGKTNATQTAYKSGVQEVQDGLKSNRKASKAPEPEKTRLVGPGSIQSPKTVEKSPTPPVNPVIDFQQEPPSAVVPVEKSPAYASKNEADLYQKGQAYLKTKQFDKAAQIFERMLIESPQGKLAPNARYWLGESYYARGAYKKAGEEFKRCAQDYPQSEKAADALLKLSYCHDRLGEGPEAMIALDILLKRYPSSNAANLVRSGRSGFSQ